MQNTLRRLSRGIGLGVLSAAAAAALLPSAASAEAPKGELVVAMPLLRQQFDPTLQIAIPDFGTYQLLFDGLLNLGSDGKIPGLAESWTVSEDGKQLDFKLRAGIKFHNGDALTAEDVKFTYERLLQPGNTHSYRQAFVELLERVEAVAPEHVRFHLKGPWPAFFTSARYPLVGIVPKAYYEKVGPKGFQNAPIGTGPYKLAGLQAAEWNRFEANADYWGGAPNVKTVTIRLVKEPFTSYAMLERGEADIVVGLTGPLLDRIRSNPKLRVVLSKYNGTSGLYFNKKSFPQSADKRVRQAVGLAVNREAIAKNLLSGICEPASSIFTPVTYGFKDGLPLVGYDPEKAKGLLKEAGVQPGTTVTYTLHTESFASLPNAPQVLEAIAGNLEAVGFKVERKPFESSAWMAMMRGGKQPSIFYGPSSLPDDGGETINGWYTSRSVWSSGNINIPEYDDIFKKQLQLSNPDERTALLRKFAELETKNVESAPLFWCHTPFAVSSRIKSWAPGLGSGYHLNLHKLEFAN